MASVRLDTVSEATLNRLAQQRGQTWSEVLREALQRLAEAETERSAYDRLRPYIGCSDSGGQQLSERTGVRFRELLEEKQRARGPG